MKYYFTLLFFIPFLSFTQNTLEIQLDSIATSEDASSFLKINKPEDGKLYTFNKEKHKTRLAISLFKLSKGEKKVIKNDFKKTYYKVINKAEVEHCKFKIIVFDGQKTSVRTAKILRDKVLIQYNEGFNFKDLAKQHSSDTTAKTGGDTGWIKLGAISDAFDAQAFNQKHILNEVFTIDDVEHKKYYIVMKTEDKKPIEEITVLKFSEDID